MAFADVVRTPHATIQDETLHCKVVVSSFLGKLFERLAERGQFGGTLGPVTYQLLVSLPPVRLLSHAESTGRIEKP